MQTAVCVIETAVGVIEAAGCVIRRPYLSQRGSRSASVQKFRAGGRARPVRGEGGDHLLEEIGGERGIAGTGAGWRSGDGSGERFRLDADAGRGREGDGAEAAQEDAEEASGFTVGDAVFAVGDEAAEDDVDVEGNVGGGEGGCAAAKVAPARYAGEGVTGLLGRAGHAAAMMETELVAAQGEGTAFPAGGQDVGTFGAHGFSSGNRKAPPG